MEISFFEPRFYKFINQISRQDLFLEIDISKIALALLTSILRLFQQIAHPSFKLQKGTAPLPTLQTPMPPPPPKKGKRQQQ